jgi:hypothetical protein
MTTQTTVNCPFCEKPVPAHGGHICANPTESFLTAHNCHDAVQPLQGAYGDTEQGEDPDNERAEGE